jgi:ATP-dependent Zn protease
MSKDDKKVSEKKDKNQNKQDNNKKPQWRAPLMVWVLLAVFIFSLVSLFNGGGEGLQLGAAEAPLSQLEFWQRVEAGIVRDEAGLVKGNAALAEVKLIREDQDDTFLQGQWLPKPAADGAMSTKGEVFQLNMLDTEGLETRLAQAGVRTIQENHRSWFGPIVISLLPIALFFILFYVLFMRKMGGGGEGPFAFGKSRAKMMNKEDAKVRFKDVAGVDEAKE